MPLIGLVKSTGEVIDISIIKNPRAEIKKGDIKCRFCPSDFSVVAGSIKVNHFRHKVSCTGPEHHPESARHMRTKNLVRDNMEHWFPNHFGGSRADVEVHIPEANRIADVMFTFETGWKVAVEIQLASITMEDLEKRSNDYESADVSCIWLLGGKADTRANRQWCQERYGTAYKLEYDLSYPEFTKVITQEHLVYEG